MRSVSEPEFLGTKPTCDLARLAPVSRAARALAVAAVLLVTGLHPSAASDNTNWKWEPNQEYGWTHFIRYEFTTAFPQTMKYRVDDGGDQDWNEWDRQLHFVWSERGDSRNDIVFDYENLGWPCDTDLACAKVWGYGAVSRADIWFNAEYSWYTGTSQPLAGKYDTWGTASHELGHTVELLHADDRAYDTMYPYYSLKWRDLSSHDKAGLFELYGAH